MVAKCDEAFEGVAHMREVIVLAGKNKPDVSRLMRCLETQGYDSSLCRTVKELTAELKILPFYSARMALVILEGERLMNASDDLVADLSKCAPDIRFIVLEGTNTPFPAENLLSGQSPHPTMTGSELPEYVFRARCTNILRFAEAESSDPHESTSDAQTVLAMSSATVEIADLATRMDKPHIRALAEQAIDLLEDIQVNRRGVLSDESKGSLFALIGDLKGRILNST